MQTLTTGEKIRQLRKAIGLKQEDITNEELSKSLISLIEKNKRNLTKNTANIIADSLNKYYKQVGKEITPEYLLETEEDQIKKTIQKDLEYLQKIINSDDVEEKLVHTAFEKVMGLVTQWGLKEELVELKILRGNFYYNNYQYNEALKDFFEVLNHSIQATDYGQIARMYNALGSVYQMQMMTDTAIVHFVQAYDTADINNTTNKDKVKVHSVFNQILCYYNITRYDLALNHINKFKELKWEDPLYKVFNNQVILMEANTYRDLKNFDKAIKLYDRLKHEEEELDKETLFLLYENYSVFFRQQGKMDKALDYINKAFTMKDHVDVNYIPALYLYQAKCYHLLEDNKKVVALLEQGLRLAELVSKNYIVIDLHFAFAEIYIELKDFSSALCHLQEAEKVIEEKDMNSKKHDLYSFYCDVYWGMGDEIKAKTYLNKIRKSYLKDI